MNTAVWIVQILLALAFIVSGSAKATQPYEKLKQQMAYVESLSLSSVRGIGILEVLAAVGLVLPALTGILPWLTPLAAVGLLLTMIGAAALHIRRGEYSQITINLVLLAMAAFVAYGRFVAVPL